MTKINITIPTGEKVDAQLVRFFEAYGKKYLVYTLNEKDEQGYVKLYVARVDEAADTKTVAGEFIEYDEEWTNVKNEFKKMISANGENVNDLNPADLNGINVRGQRVIKLMEGHVNSLSANQKQFVATAPSAPQAPTMDFSFQQPVMPEVPQAPVEPAPQSTFAPTFDQPASPYPSMSDYNAIPSYVQEATPQNETPVQPVASNNYEEMYNELKTKFDRINAELEKVTNENIELRIKIDDIKEILNEN